MGGAPPAKHTCIHPGLPASPRQVRRRGGGGAGGAGGHCAAAGAHGARGGHSPRLRHPAAGGEPRGLFTQLGSSSRAPFPRSQAPPDTCDPTPTASHSLRSRGGCSCCRAASGRWCCAMPQPWDSGRRRGLASQACLQVIHSSNDENTRSGLSGTDREKNEHPNRKWNQKRKCQPAAVAESPRSVTLCRGLLRLLLLLHHILLQHRPPGSSIACFWRRTSEPSRAGHCMQHKGASAACQRQAGRPRQARWERTFVT